MIYLYCTDDGEVHELVMTVAQMQDRQRSDRTIVLDDGRVARRRVDLEHVGFKNTSGNWPMSSRAAGVGAHQIDKAMAVDSQLGVGETEYTKKGYPVFRSKTHRDKYLRAHQMHDRDAWS